MVTTSVQLSGQTFKNPVLAASGTAAFGQELAASLDWRQLGGLCTTGLTREPRAGNRPPRVAETASGMLNSVGLQNPGLDRFLKDEWPALSRLGCPVIANVAGNSLDDYVHLCQRLDQTDVAAIELNLSCPNVQTGCMLIGADPEQVFELVQAAREATDKALWVKLTPNVTDIVQVARAAEKAGADALVLINTLLGMAIDRSSRRPLLKNNTGGLSGPAIKPVALRMVAQVYQQVSLPLIGVGGIMTGADAIDFMIAGASAVQVGTATLLNPQACQLILSDMVAIARADGVKALADYTGTLNWWT